MGIDKTKQERERSDETTNVEAAKEKDIYRQAEEDKETTAKIEAEKEKDRHRDD